MTSSRVTAAALLMFIVLELAACTDGPSSVAPTDAASTPPQQAEGAEDSGGVIRQEDFQIRYVLDGVTTDSTAVGLVQNRQLALVPVLASGDPVQKGQELGRLAVAPEIRSELEAGAVSSRLDASRLDRLLAMEREITSPVSGVLDLTGPAPAVASPGIDVVVDLTPIQALRYQSLRFTGRATVETVVGEREVGCESVWTEPVADTTTATDTGGDPGSSELHCRLPAHIETAAGLRAQVTLESEVFPDAVVVPNLYVHYDPATDGYVITVDQGGTHTTIPVDVSVTDGVVRVITSEVPVGAALVAASDDVADG